MEDKQIFKGTTEKNLELIIRYPVKSDVEIMLNYINTLSDERTFITYQGEHETLESETRFLEEKLKNIENKSEIFLLAFSGDQLAGITWIGMSKKTAKHVGILGISVAKQFRNKGVGKQLMTTVIEEATKQISRLEIITLEVYSKNLVALELYNEFGFIEYGNLPNGVKREDEYDNAIFMYKKIK